MPPLIDRRPKRRSLDSESLDTPRQRCRPHPSNSYMYMKQTNETELSQQDRALIELGHALISRFVQHEEQTPAPQANAETLQYLQALLASFLDRSSKQSVTLQSFRQDSAQSYYIEFNASFHTALHIEKTLTALFATGPHPFAIERYLGAATDCLKITRLEKAPQHPLPKPPIGLSPSHN
ncbi:hypothetical protein [Pelagicoccus sp. SDUM812005]|uniref:hypothetical protein n=1 Tax=Pelagicoccus sp. SDUM812005 TaxID=3041257 RepID=UPI002811630A|nr:hypothetical protein [Pelagicoccus sp. SDUM812005]